MFGESPKLLESLEIAERAAPTELPVLIDGESGTGKELLARVVHANGSRSDRPFVSVNCGAIPENLLESELFGHKKGAFTGAVSDRKGKFEAAHERHDLSGRDRRAAAVGPGEAAACAAVARDPARRLRRDHRGGHARGGRDEPQSARDDQAGTFREDLFYRLSVVQVSLPPLRERTDEIPLLIEYFSDEAAEKLDRRPIRLSARLRRFLLNYAYPGNVRELSNIIYRISCLADDVADLRHLPEGIRPDSPAIETGRRRRDGRCENTLSGVKKAASDEAERLFIEKACRRPMARWPSLRGAST